MKRLIIVGAALVSLWSAPLARAVILFSDSFDYPNGDLLTASTNLWVHHSGNTTGQVQVVSGRVFLTGSDSEDVSAYLAGQPYPTTTNIFLYASFVVSFTALPSSSGEYFAHFKDSGATLFRDKLFATTSGAQAGRFRLGVANVSNTPNAILETDLYLITNYTVVTRYVVSNATSTLWINPSVESDPSVTATNVTSPITVQTFALRQSSGIGSFYLDNLVVGTSFGDVVPTVPPSITTQPQSQIVTTGTDVSFSVVASGSSPLHYQWHFNLTNSLDNETNSTLTLASVTANRAGVYAVTITNAIGSTNSDPATLTVNLPPPPSIVTQPQSLVVTEGGDATFTVLADGSPPLVYQWQFNGTDLSGATTSALTLFNVTTNQVGAYTVRIANGGGSTNSQPATLTLSHVTVVSILTYNVLGSGASDWSTNSTQVQAIGRQMQHLNPDIITFQEIPVDLAYEMTNFVNVFLPGYFLVTSPNSDGFTRSSIASRFAITRSQSWLAHADLHPFGYTNANPNLDNFTRDLYEAQINTPNFNLPLHVFTAHLKSGSSSDEIAKRNAEGLAVSNFFVSVFLTNNSTHPYILTGDLNETDTNQVSIKALTSSPTGLKLTTPLNPFTGSALTYSIKAAAGLTKRFDYFMPCNSILTNMVSSQIFQSDLLLDPPPPLLRFDDTNASDHLPVIMSFNNPFNQPFRLLSVGLTNQTLTLGWESASNRQYRVEASSNLTDWSVFASSLLATGATRTLTTNVTAPWNSFRVYRVP